MSESHLTESDFLKQVTEVIEAKLSDEQFGVSDLSHAVGMSRSNLLRKIKKLTGLSVSKFIRQVRLKHAMEILKDKTLSVSEVSYRVGFNSTSYFVKCFREHYGYPPGEAANREYDESETQSPVQSHQLVAIMFTDIEGYTALMQKDETKALQFRSRHREVFNTATKKYNGQILQYYGDGTLSIFKSVIDAVKCGIELQSAFQQAPVMPVRVGIHSGDIILSKEEVIGDGVNIASRIESLATAGSVLISGKVYDEVKNQSGIQTASLGDFEFKNVDRPLEVFAIANQGLVVPARGELTGKLKKKSGPRWRMLDLIWVLIVLAIGAGGYFFYQAKIADQSAQNFSTSGQMTAAKSIAVLPFINDSNDSTNVYVINGLMESILNHLQKIGDLRVVSRTSAEKYRNTNKSIPEIAQELGVQYIVEGSGQKINDEILLNIQLIEAASDKHLWSQQYERETADIFSLQKEVAKKIAGEIQVVITPAVEKRIDKVPTANLEAYDYFLKGLESFYQRDYNSLEQAITYYSKAIEHDPEFARAHAGIAISYFFLDYYQVENQYSELINSYADKALLYDAELPQSLIAKAVYYLQLGEYELALPHLEKALEYNPNSALVINVLSDFYARFVPNTAKYLEYALKGVRIDIASNDSATASFTFLHISNALVQCGFVDEAVAYINKSIEYDPENLYAAYVKAYVLLAKNHDLAQTKILLLETLMRDSTRLDVMQEVAKICYFMQDFDEAYKYYKKFADIRSEMELDIFHSENAKIAVVMRKMGFDAEANKYMQYFKDYTANDQSIYKSFNLAVISAYNGDKAQAIEHLKQFSNEENYFYWILVFTDLDPALNNIKNLREFKKIMRDIETKFWKRHDQIRNSLEEQNLI